MLALRAGVARANRDFAGTYRAVYVHSGCNGCSLFRDSAVTLILDSLNHEEAAAIVEGASPKRFRPSDSLQAADPAVIIEDITGVVIGGPSAARLTVGQREFRGTWRLSTLTYEAPWLSTVSVDVSFASAPGQFDWGIGLVNPAWSLGITLSTLPYFGADGRGGRGQDSVWAIPSSLTIDPSFWVLFLRRQQ